MHEFNFTRSGYHAIFERLASPLSGNPIRYSCSILTIAIFEVRKAKKLDVRIFARLACLSAEKKINKEARYSPVSRLSDTRYSAKGIDYQIPFVTQLIRPKGNGGAIRYPLLSKIETYSAKGTKGKWRYYSAKGTEGKWRYSSSKARLKCATYPRSQYISETIKDRESGFQI